ncbi:hypothetical protein [Fusibacter sp. JL216-2]|uniref:hypothetical protein n=1 Tax=Fusibacter sp. JL216-2 TaxID=3071453 RepID=UPI003D326ED6
MKLYIDDKKVEMTMLDKKSEIDFIKEYLCENYDMIDAINIKIDDSKSKFYESLTEFNDLINEILPSIKKSYIGFYQNINTEIWNDFVLLIDTIGQIHEKYNNTSTVVPENYNNEWAKVGNTLIKVNQILIQMQTAMERKDEILMADVIKWEYYPLINDIRDIIADILPNKRCRHEN